MFCFFKQKTAYDIVSELGRGAMGVVYKGLDPVINRYVAIKTVIRQGGGAEAAELAERFKQEAQAAGRLNHPAVVGVYDYGEDDDQAYIVMEFVDGPILRTKAEAEETFDAATRRDIGLRVVDTMVDLHAVDPDDAHQPGDVGEAAVGGPLLTHDRQGGGLDLLDGRGARTFPSAPGGRTRRGRGRGGDHRTSWDDPAGLGDDCATEHYTRDTPLTSGGTSALS